MELKDIRAIIDLMKKNDLAVFKLEKEGFKLELEAHRQAAPWFVLFPGINWLLALRSEAIRLRRNLRQP